MQLLNQLCVLICGETNHSAASHHEYDLVSRNMGRRTRSELEWLSLSASASEEFFNSRDLI